MALPTTLSPVLLLSATVLLLFVSLSTPIIPALYLLDVHAILLPDQPPPTVATTIRAGVWGYCASSAANPDAQRCSNNTLGYKMPDDILQLTGQPQAASIVVEALTFVLVLHPISAFLAFAALGPGVASLYTYAPHAWGVAALVISFLAAFLTSVSAAIDVALVAIAKSRLSALLQGLGLRIGIDYGPAVWMTVGAAGLLWLEVLFASIVVCDCCGFGIEHEQGRDPGVHVNANAAEKPNGTA
ncbi:hypothetical protein AURDEDRAFT_113583 [Auricularia subglabra TFB-10046 SS5]|nr:hypothetical protein AURDEDRAFT_113583 [Auricularia subglabra TFB-10046 SS5]